MPSVGSRSNSVSTPFDVTTPPPPPPVSTPVVPPPTPPKSPPAQPPGLKPKRRFGLGKIVLTALALIVLIGGGILTFRLLNPDPNSVNSQRTEDAATAFDTLDIPLDEVGLASQILTTRTLNINGQLKVDKSLILTPSTRPTAGIAGQMYYDSGTNQLAYYNGTGYVELGTNPQTVTSIGGASGTLTLGGGLSLNGSTLSNTGVVSITSASTNLTVTNDNGNVTIANTPGAPQGVQSVGGTNGKIALFNGGQTIGDSLLSQAGNLLTADANFQVNGAIELQAADTVTLRLTDTTSGVVGQIYNDGNLHVNGGQNNLWLDAGGSGTIFMNAANGNKVAIGQATDPTYLLEVNGDINISDAGGSLRIGGTAICTISGCISSGGGGAGVTSLNGIDGALTLANATAAGTIVTIDDATTTTKGIASYNTNNFTVTAGAVNTIQNIGTTAAPTFGQLTLTSSQASAAMLTVNNTNAGATGNLLDLRLNGTSEFAVSPLGNVTLNGTVNGQTISSAASFTGTVGVSGNINTSATLFANAVSVTTNVNASGTISGGALSVTNNAGIGGSLTVTGTTSTNTITPTAALTVGSTSQSFTLQGSATSTITATGGGFTTTVGFTGTPTAAVAYNFDRASAAGTYLICTTAGNCSGVGGGVTTAGGTTNRLAKFTGSQAIGNSTLSDDGTNVITTADLIVQGGDTTLGVANSQTGSLNFAHSGSAFIGTISQSPLTASRTYLLPDASGTVCLSSGNCSGSGSSNTLQAAYDAGNTVTTTNARNLLFTMSDLATDPNFLVNLECDTSCSTNGRFAIQDDGSDVFSVSPATGAALFQNSVNSTVAFQIKNAGGTNSFLVDNANGAYLFGEDTVGKHVQIDLTSADGVLDIGASGGNLHLTLSQLSNGAAKINTDSDLIVQRDTNSTSAFQVQNANGTTSVLTIDTTNILTRISGAGSDSTLVSGTGAVQIGADNDFNMSFDNNEIIARNNGGVSTLFLQNGGGGVNIGASSTVIQVTSNGDSFTVLNAGSNRVVNVDTAEGELELGAAAALNGAILFRNSTNAFTTLLRAPSSTAHRSISLPDADGTVCLQSSTSCGFALTSGSANYIQNQTASAQTTSNFWISGNGRADTAFLAPSYDTGTAVALAVGGTTASSVNLGRSGINTNVVGNLIQSTGTFSLTGNNTSSISTSTNSLTITSASTATWSTTSGSLTLQSTNGSNNIVINGGSNTMTFNTGSSGTITLGSANTSTVNLGAQTNNTRTVNVGYSASTQAQTVNIGATASTSTTNIYGGTGGINMASTGGTAIKQSGLVPGTVSNSAASATVTGASTTFLSTFQQGDTFTITSSGNSCTISQIASDTSLTCTATLAGSSSGSTYSYTAQSRLSVIDNGQIKLGGNLLVSNPSVADQYSLRVNPTTSVFTMSANTAGNTSQYRDGSDSGNNNLISASKYNSGTGGTINALRVFFPSVAGSPNNQVKVAVYSDSAGAPGTLLSSASAPATVATAGAWTTVSLGSTVTLAPNTNYWFGFNVNSSSTQYAYQNGAASTGAYVAMTFTNNFPASFGTPSSTSAIQYSIYGAYITVTESSGTPTNGISLNNNNELIIQSPWNSDNAIDVRRKDGLSIFNVSTLDDWVGMETLAVGDGYDSNYKAVIGGATKIYRHSSTATHNLLELYSDVGGSGTQQLKVEANGNLTTLGKVTSASFGGAGLTDCDATNSKLLWDSTTSQFSCGTDRASLTIRKPSDESVTNSAVLQNDDNFSFSIGAGETWAFQIYADVDSTAAGDFKSNLTAPAGSTCRYSVNNLYNVQNYTTGLCNDSGITPHSDAFDNEYLIYGTVVTAGTAGTVQWQWSQGTADATATTVRAGSQMIAYKISGADLAEAYYTNDNSIAPGDIVSLDTNSAAGVVKSAKAYDTKAIGVVSTQPGQVLA
ncbi:MAG TPA: hypothetical protein VJM46_05125, partial [Candidatus Saccharimonadales bacterium]|nr:hypothetical protein [Candidatus Saccharimonadales bacterium]